MNKTNRKGEARHLRVTPPASRLPPLLMAAAAVAIALGGCGTTPPRTATDIESAPTARVPPPVATKRGGGYYLDDGPGENPPPDLDRVPDAVPRVEPLHRGALRPYTVMGRSYTPMTSLAPYSARGIASWYGRRYHGKPTSSGEPYDMYAMTAAHPVLPIPSYAKVTNLKNGRSVVVRINDRGPFLSGRLIDLSYTAAYKLGVLNGGSAYVEVETITPDLYAAYAKPNAVAAPEVAPAAPVAPTAVTVNEGDPIARLASAAEAGSAPAPSADVPDATAAQAAPGAVYLQLGAFGSRENAESYLSRVKAQLEGLAERLQLLMRDGFYRVHAGPYASAAQARAAADRMSQALGTMPLLVNR